MVKVLLLIVMIAVADGIHAQPVIEPDSLSATGGQVLISIYRDNLPGIGLEIQGLERADFQNDTIDLQISNANQLQFQSTGGFFSRLQKGSLSLNSGLGLKVSTGEVSSDTLRIVPKQQSRDSLQILDEQGFVWFDLDYGHYEIEGEWLHARYLDLRISHDLALRLNDINLSGHIIGFAMLKTKIEPNFASGLSGTEFLSSGIGSNCPVLSPNWPGQNGYFADVAMLKLPVINQVARVNGRVAITTSAYFENIGSADIPWFAQFADSRQADDCCVDQGDGFCAPFGNDQGGKLVYAFYRYSQGRLEQLGQSHVKHAFNSVNLDTADGSLDCRAENRGGRVVPSGCEDLYQANTNANQAFLGPRTEIIAHTTTWLRDGSIWDLTGPEGSPDGHCDYPPSNFSFGGEVPCFAPASDSMDRRLSVAEADLSTVDARYFIEAWYLNRGDIDIFNSHGHKEVTPSFSSVWTFSEAAPFKQGPVIDEFVSLKNPDSASLLDTVDSGEGQLRVSSTVSVAGPGLWQYDIAMMNFDFDRAIDSIEIPIVSDANIQSISFTDSDENAANDWLITVSGNTLKFTAPEAAQLMWGSLVSFSYIADRAPIPVDANLGVAAEGLPAALSLQTLGTGDTVFENSFESTPEE
jgi:hypothetical protein